MNRTIKTILIISAALIPVGAISMALGMHFGGGTAFALDMDNWKNMMPVDSYNEARVLQEFDSLEVSVSEADVTLTGGDSYKMEYTVNTTSIPVITEEGGKLIVKEPEMRTLTFDPTGSLKGPKYRITVPMGSDAKNISIISSSGDVEIDHVTVSGTVQVSSGDISLLAVSGSELSLNTVSGDIECADVSVPALAASTTTGDIGMDGGKCGNVKCIATTGDVELSSVELQGADCKVTTGDISMLLTGKESDYTFDLSTTSGDIELNGVETEDGSKKTGSGPMPVTANTMSGDIEVTTH